MTEDRFATYRTAKSTRPSWATALILAGVLAIAGVFAAFAGLSVGGWFFVAASIAALVAGILALTGVRRGV